MVGTPSRSETTHPDCPSFPVSPCRIIAWPAVAANPTPNRNFSETQFPSFFKPTSVCDQQRRVPSTRTGGLGSGEDIPGCAGLMSSPSPSPRETGGKAQGTSSLQSPGDGGKRSRRKLVPLPQGDRSSWPGSVGDGSQYGNDASDEPTGSASQSREMVRPRALAMTDTAPSTVHDSRLPLDRAQLLNESHDNGSSPLPMVNVSPTPH